MLYREWTGARAQTFMFADMRVGTCTGRCVCGHWQRLVVLACSLARTGAVQHTSTVAHAKERGTQVRTYSTQSTRTRTHILHTRKHTRAQAHTRASASVSIMCGVGVRATKGACACQTHQPGLWQWCSRLLWRVAASWCGYVCISMSINVVGRRYGHE